MCAWVRVYVCLFVTRCVYGHRCVICYSSKKLYTCVHVCVLKSISESWLIVKRLIQMQLGFLNLDYYFLF